MSSVILSVLIQKSFIYEHWFIMLVGLNARLVFKGVGRSKQSYYNSSKLIST